jgi:hypothetical protein
MTTSFFDDVLTRSMEEWNDSPGLAISYTPTIIPAIRQYGGAGSIREHNFPFMTSHSMFEWAIDTASDFKLTLENMSNNTTNRLLFSVQQSNYKGVTFSGTLTAKGAQQVSMIQWEKAVNMWLSKLNIFYDQESYNGAYGNNGLITGVTPDTTSFVYTTAKQMGEKIIELVKLFNTSNGKGAYSPATVMLSGSCVDTYRTGFIDANSSISLRQMLQDAGITVLLVDPMVNNTNRMDIVEFALLTADMGKIPQVISPMTKIEKEGVNGGILQMFVGYQSMAIHKSNDTVVKSYIKVP